MDSPQPHGSVDRRHPGHSLDRWPDNSDRRDPLAAWSDNQAILDDYNYYYGQFPDRADDHGNRTLVTHIVNDNDDNYELRSQDGSVCLYYIDGKTHVIFRPDYESSSFLNNVQLVDVLKQHDIVLSSRCPDNSPEVPVIVKPIPKVEAKHFVWVVGVLLLMFVAMTFFWTVAFLG